MPPLREFSGCFAPDLMAWRAPRLTSRAGKDITDAPNSTNQGMPGFKLLAQAANVYVERPVRRGCFAFEQALCDLVARYDPAGRTSQQIEDVELHCSQIYQALALPHLAPVDIDTDLSKPGDRFIQMMGTGDSPKDRTNA